MTDFEFSTAIARELCYYRRKLGFTQQEIYDATGIHIGRIENNSQSMRLITYCKLCKFMGIQFQKILDRVMYSDFDEIND